MAFLQLVSVSGKAAELRQHFKQFRTPIYTRAAGGCAAVLVRARFTGSSIVGVTTNADLGVAIPTCRRHGGRLGWRDPNPHLRDSDYTTLQG